VHSTAALAVRQPHLLLRDAYARCVAFRCVSLCLVIRNRANDSRTKRVQDRDTARSALAVTQHVAFRSGSGVRIDSTRRAKEQSAVTMNRKRRDVVDNRCGRNRGRARRTIRPAVLQNVVRDFAPVGETRGMCRTVDCKFEAACCWGSLRFRVQTTTMWCDKSTVHDTSIDRHVRWSCAGGV
jgi:hypothetical protein